MTPISPPDSSHATRGSASTATTATEAAIALEASFLAEMLKHAGVGKTPGAFGGGIGEDQFASLLREVQARDMARHGGIGLAEAVLRSLRPETEIRP